MEPAINREYISGRGSESIVPPQIKHWNWGAFLLSWVWGIGNSTFIALLTLVPFLNFVMPFVLGAKGNEWAWRNRIWLDVYQFKSIQRKWKTAGLLTWLVYLMLFIAIPLTMFQRAPLYMMSLAKVANHHEVIQYLGAPISAHWSVTGSYKTNRASGRVALKYTITGPKGSATVYTYANKHAGSWALDEVIVHIKEPNHEIRVVGSE